MATLTAYVKMWRLFIWFSGDSSGYFLLRVCFAKLFLEIVRTLVNRLAFLRPSCSWRRDGRTAGGHQAQILLIPYLLHMVQFTSDPSLVSIIINIQGTRVGYLMLL
jgi:hypothetical protein